MSSSGPDPLIDDLRQRVCGSHARSASPRRSVGSLPGCPAVPDLRPARCALTIPRHWEARYPEANWQWQGSGLGQPLHHRSCHLEKLREEAWRGLGGAMGSQGWEGWLAGSRGGVSAAGEDRVELPVEAHRRLAALVAEQPLDGLERIGVAVEVELRHEM